MNGLPPKYETLLEVQPVPFNTEGKSVRFLPSLTRPGGSPFRRGRVFWANTLAASRQIGGFDVAAAWAAASGKLSPAEKEQISIQCYHGPADKEHWIRYDNFRIVRLAD